MWIPETQGRRPFSLLNPLLSVSVVYGPPQAEVPLLKVAQTPSNSAALLTSEPSLASAIWTFNPFLQ